ncbi:MAG: hypothetical protein SF029_24430 [bacterium]|nr:hypothetical protein [bacterium]
MFDLILQIKHEGREVQVETFRELQSLLDQPSPQALMKTLRYLETYHGICAIFTDNGVVLRQKSTIK